MNFVVIDLLTYMLELSVCMFLCSFIFFMTGSGSGSQYKLSRLEIFLIKHGLKNEDDPEHDATPKNDDPRKKKITSTMETT